MVGLASVCILYGLSDPAMLYSSQQSSVYINTVDDSIRVDTNFPNGGGRIQLIGKHPLTIRVQPHDEGGAGWGKVWFHFSVEGVKPGDEVVIELEKGNPSIAGIAKQIVYSHDGNNWDLVKAGMVSPDNTLFVYKHTAQSGKLWFAYHFPYTSREIDQLLVPSMTKAGGIKIFEITKSRKGRSVTAIDFNSSQQPKKYGIWIQARAHAFESGASWLAHYLAEWLASGDTLASALRGIADITIVPIVDVDGVGDGRTGKNTQPHDHGRSWNDDDPYWPEIKAIQSLVKSKAAKHNMDLFIDIHGPGGGHHPFFIVPLEKDLPFKDQQTNRASFFAVLQAAPLEERVKGVQSMTGFHYSARPVDKFEPGNGTPPQWATISLNQHIVAMTLETNMNSPLSTLAGYQEQASKLGKAIAIYFVRDMHKK